MAAKLDEPKPYFDKFNELEEWLSKTFNNIISDLKNEITKEIQHEVSKWCRQLDSENKMLKKVAELGEWILIHNHATKNLISRIGIFA